MKDASRTELERDRPKVEALAAISHCLDRLFMDRRHGLADEVVERLTFEELTGALLLARDAAAGRRAEGERRYEDPDATPSPGRYFQGGGA